MSSSFHGMPAFTYDDLRDALVDLGRYVVACNAMHRSQERSQERRQALS